MKQATVDPGVGKASGLPASKMTKAQKMTLVKLIKAYTDRMPKDIAMIELKAVEKGGIDKIRFEFGGGASLDQPHTYRVHGPHFVIQFLNTQGDPKGNVPNHVHSAFRRQEGDFGS